MNAMLILIIAAACLIVGYLTYGRWLAKQWGVDPNRPTPAHEMEDGVDYVPAPPYVVLGHHFSSIAGAGPINGPIQAAVFGWVPVLLWVVIGGIFFGAMHDFGALFASLRHKGQTLAAVVAKNIDNTAKRLFCVFAYLTLVLVVAAFASIVANTFAVVPTTGLEGEALTKAENSNFANMRTAMISLLFIAVAIVWGLATRGKKLSPAVTVGGAIVIIIAIVAVGYNLPIIALDYTTWMVLLGIYILVASVAPVWILLQPRDYLSSYLLYGMIILAVIAIIGATIAGAASALEIPAFSGLFVTNAAVDASGAAIMDPNTGLAVVNKAAASGWLFPALFITIACGAISGFHSLVASGTTSKQLDKEGQAQAIGYGGMLIESLLAVISLLAVGFVWTSYQAGDFAAPTAVFATGLSSMLACIPGLQDAQSMAYALLILAVSAFCLTSLDTATRLARYMFQEMFMINDTELDNAEERTTFPTWRKTLTNPYVATIITVCLGVGLGLTGYTIIWPLFGAANQLLAALALLTVCAWLGNAGRNNKMFYIPMVFMLAVTLTSLCQTIMAKLALLGGDAAVLAAQAGGVIGVSAQLIIAVLLCVLAIVLAAKGAKTIFGSKTATA